MLILAADMPVLASYRSWMYTSDVTVSKVTTKGAFMSINYANHMCAYTCFMR